METIRSYRLICAVTTVAACLLLGGAAQAAQSPSLVNCPVKQQKAGSKFWQCDLVRPEAVYINGVSFGKVALNWVLQCPGFPEVDPVIKLVPSFVVSITKASVPTAYKAMHASARCKLLLLAVPAVKGPQWDLALLITEVSRPAP